MTTKVKLIAPGVITPSELTLTTASGGTNTTAPATTAFVQQEISSLVDSSPGALNTLNELAAALGDDANFSTTVTNSIATKLPLAGGTVTGTTTFTGGDGVVVQTSSDTFLQLKTTGSGSNYVEFKDSGGAAGNIRYNHSTNLLSIKTNGIDNRLVIDSSGNVGIGTAGAANLRQLDLKNTSHSLMAISAGTGHHAGVFYYEGTTEMFNQYYDNSSDKFILSSSAIANQFVIDRASGNVGIGIATPTARLDVRRGDASGKIAEFHNNVGYGVDIGSSTAVAYISSGYNQRLDFKTDPTSGQTERMSILANGNVGIGISNPLQKLSVGARMNVDTQGDYYGAWADGDTSGDSFFAVGTWHNNGGRMSAGSSIGAGLHLYTHNTSHHLTLQKDGGRVGIGTASPGANIHIYSSGQAIARVEGANEYYSGLMIRNNHSSTQSQWHVAAAGGTSGWGAVNGNFIIRDDTTNSTGIEIERGAGGATGALYIDSSGRVGINRTPSISNSKLEVGGADNVSLINVEASGNTGGMGIGSSGLQLFHGSSSKMTIDSSGNVGIGTASPTSYAGDADNLVIYSAAETGMTIVSGTASTGDIYFADGTSAQNRGFLQYHHADDSLRFGTSATIRMRIDSSGNLLVGKSNTTFSNYGVELRAGNGGARFIRSNAEPVLMNRVGGDGRILGLYFAGNEIGYLGSNTTAGQTLLDISSEADANSNIRFLTYGSSSHNEVMRLTSAGNVGIGTTSPDYKLEVAGNTMIGDASAVTSPSFAARQNIVSSFQHGVNGIGRAGSLYLLNTNTNRESGFLTFGAYYNNTNNLYYHTGGIGGGKETAAGSGWGGYLSFWTTSDGTAGAASGQFEHMRITADGNVGIGTASPTGYRLVVENTSEDLLKLHNSTDGLDSLISFTNPGGTLARIQGIDNGGLGFDVGNNAGGIISNAMSIDASGNAYFRSAGHTNLEVRSGSLSTKAFIQTVQDSDIRIGSSTNHPVAFYANGQERLKINSSTGNVNIGSSLMVGATTTPGEKLHVKGTGRFENSHSTPVSVHINSGNHDYGQIFASTASAWKNLVLNQYGGNVGIGLTSGISSRLHVNTEMSLGADGDNRAILGYTPNRFYIGTRQGATNYFDTVSVSGGKVGIGTTSMYSGATLSVAGSTVLANGNQFVIGTFGTSGLQLIGTAGGNNIIGTMGTSEPLIFRTGSSERMRIGADGYISLFRNANEYGLELKSAGTRSGLVLKKPGTDTIQGSLLMLADESYRLGTASHYHHEMLQNGYQRQKTPQGTTFTITQSFTCTGSSVTRHVINIASVLGASTSGSLRYEVAAVGYGSGGTNGVNAKYSVAGYSGHSYSATNHNSFGAGTIQNGYKSSNSTSYDAKGISYHPCINMGSYIANGEIYAYVPAAQQYGFAVSNDSSSSFGMTIIITGFYT